MYDVKIYSVFVHVHVCFVVFCAVLCSDVSVLFCSVHLFNSAFEILLFCSVVLDWLICSLLLPSHCVTEILLLLCCNCAKLDSSADRCRYLIVLLRSLFCSADNVFSSAGHIRSLLSIIFLVPSPSHLGLASPRFDHFIISALLVPVRHFITSARHFTTSDQYFTVLFLYLLLRLDSSARHFFVLYFYIQNFNASSQAWCIYTTELNNISADSQ